MAANNMRELEAMLMKELRKSMNVASEKMLADMYEETGKFYTKGKPKQYIRTGALGDTPKTTALTVAGNTVSFEAYLDKDHQYITGDNPNMEQVLNLANSGKAWTTKGGKQARATLGKKGFWEASEKKMERTFNRTMRKFFKKI